MSAYEVLAHDFLLHFTGTGPDVHRSTTFYDREAFTIVGRDTLHQDTIEDSNVTVAVEEINNRFPGTAFTDWIPYAEYACVWVEDLETNEELAEMVLEMVQALEDYPILDEGHYSELEQERLEEYISETLPGEIAYYLEDVHEEQVEDWLGTNMIAFHLWDYREGSVDDYPFDAKGLAEMYKRHND